MKINNLNIKILKHSMIEQISSNFSFNDKWCTYPLNRNNYEIKNIVIGKRSDTTFVADPFHHTLLLNFVLTG